MPRRQKVSPSDSIETMVAYIPGMTFGEFMRSVRRAQRISLRALAKEVNKTPTYISDIEHGNNRPPDKDLLDTILSALQINEFPHLKAKLYDLAALGRCDIPADVKSFVIDNPDLISILRSLQSSPAQKEILAEMASQYCKGGAKNDSE